MQSIPLLFGLVVASGTAVGGADAGADLGVCTSDDAGKYFSAKVAASDNSFPGKTAPCSGSLDAT